MSTPNPRAPRANTCWPCSRDASRRSAYHLFGFGEAIIAVELIIGLLTTLAGFLVDVDNDEARCL